MAEKEARRTLGRPGQNCHPSHSYPLVMSFLPGRTKASDCLHPRMSLAMFSFPKCMQSRVFWGPWLSLYLVPPTLVFTETRSLSSLEVTK